MASGRTFAETSEDMDVADEDGVLAEFNLDDYDDDEEGRALHQIDYEEADNEQMVEVGARSHLHNHKCSSFT